MFSRLLSQPPFEDAFGQLRDHPDTIKPPERGAAAPTIYIQVRK